MKEKGILLHISSLPSPYGIGSFGKAAYEFVDFLKETHQDYWQVLPLGPTSYGDSPYQSFSCFAGNPYFIDLDILVEKGLLKKEEVKEYERPSDFVDYEWLYNTRYIVLRKAFKRFTKDSSYNKFLEDNKEWLKDYALFMALKSKYTEGNFLQFPKEYQNRYSDETLKFEKEHQEEIDFWSFLQYEFNVEWHALRKYANESGIKIIGDMPIYVAYDSSDVYSDPKNWKLNPDLTMKKVAGVPPDYFAKYGQLWGNPIYRYDVMKKDHYSWWIRRFKKAFELYDVVRIDHFRGFASYYQIGSKELTAVNGRWVKGPRYPLFKAVHKALGDVNIIAEDLGFTTPDVIDLLNDTGYPGMKILEFAFDGDLDNHHLPRNYIENLVCYTGTHDNPPLKEWLTTLQEHEINFMCDYMQIERTFDSDILIDNLIKLAINSKASKTIIPLSDYMHLGEVAHFNHPAVLGGNWIWRLNKEYYTKELVDKINELNGNK